MSIYRQRTEYESSESEKRAADNERLQDDRIREMEQGCRWVKLSGGVNYVCALLMIRDTVLLSGNHERLYAEAVAVLYEQWMKSSVKDGAE